MKLRTKISVGLSVIALIFIVTNVITYNNIKRINKNLSIISENTLPGVRALLNIRVNQLAVNTIEKELMVTMLSDSLRKKAYKRINNALKREESADSAYALLPKTEEEIEVYKSFKSEWEIFLKTHKKFMEIESVYIQNKNDNNYNELCNFNLNDIQKQYDKVTKIANKLIVINFDKNNKAKEDASKAQALTNWMLISAVFIGLIMAFFIGWYLSKTIKMDLGEEPVVVAAMTREIANGNLKVEISNAGNNIGILGAVESMKNKIGEVIIEIDDEIQTTTQAGVIISEVSGKLTQMATNQAASLEEVSSSMEEMVANIHESSENARETEKITIKLSEEIKSSNYHVNSTVNAINEITEKIKVINDIAFQTNLLALNAAVEAARAGEHGKGFAVVAAEVRKLSERSRTASDEINSLSSKCIENSRKALNQMELLVPEVEKTTTYVNSIVVSSEELNAGIEQVNNAVQELNSTTQDNVMVSEQLNSHSKNLLSKAENLKSSIEYFQV